MKLPPLTIGKLATAKGVPAGFLRSLGCHEHNAAVVIPYRQADGRQAPRSRLRTALAAKDGSRWTGPRGSDGVVPYGLWRLAEARQAGYVVIVEGESDCWALWSVGIPALGIPGATSTRVLQPEHVAGIKTIYVHREPDVAGRAFAKTLCTRIRNWAGAVP